MTADEVASRLGVKRQTVYAYVSRGRLRRSVASDGRTSLFDPVDVEQLRSDSRSKTDGELHTLITTRLTRVDDEGLWVAGQDLVGLVGRGAGFTDVVELLWRAEDGEVWPARSGLIIPQELQSLDRLRVVTSLVSSADPLRHDLSPKSVRAAGRTLITEMAHGLGDVARVDPTASVDAVIWAHLATEDMSTARLKALDTAMALLADHGLANSTFAARIAASARADPYSVVGAGLGVLGGTLHGAASNAVHELLAETAVHGDASTAIGNAHRRLGITPGFGHSVYTQQDPRFAALMARVIDGWSSDNRLRHVYRVRDVVAERSAAIPNVDLALGALTWLSGMSAAGGEAIFAVARTAGWLAHAMEEYEEAPLRFRPKAKYLGPRTH